MIQCILSIKFDDDQLEMIKIWMEKTIDIAVKKYVKHLDKM